MVLNLVDGLLLQGPLPGSGPDLHQAGVAGLLAHFNCSALSGLLGLVGLHYIPL